MAEPITRREFLRNSAMVSGAVVLADPRLLFGHGLAAKPGPAAASAGRHAAGGFTLVEYGDPGDGFLVRGTRAGGDHALELTRTAVVFQSPTRSTGTPEVIELAEFELGRGHDVIAQEFGPEALDHLRTEVANLYILGQA